MCKCNGQGVVSKEVYAGVISFIPCSCGKGKEDHKQTMQEVKRKWGIELGDNS